MQQRATKWSYHVPWGLHMLWSWSGAMPHTSHNRCMWSTPVLACEAAVSSDLPKTERQSDVTASTDKGPPTDEPAPLWLDETVPRWLAKDGASICCVVSWGHSLCAPVYVPRVCIAKIGKPHVYAVLLDMVRVPSQHADGFGPHLLIWKWEEKRKEDTRRE